MIYACYVVWIELVTVIRTAVQQGGVLSLWQGLGPTLLRDVPFSGESHNITVTSVMSEKTIRVTFKIPCYSHHSHTVL